VAPRYYQADDGAGLAAALHAIAAAAVPCTFTLPSAGPDLDVAELRIFFDQVVEVAPGEIDGWTYDAATRAVTLHGAACATLQGGEVETVDAYYECAAIS
jgi:hypothetical protein